MTPAYVAVRTDATSAQAIAAIRRLVDEAETVNYVYVVDEERHLLGVLSLYRLLLSPDDTPVEKLMAPSTVRVRASADQETAARILTDRNLLAIPVVDDDDHILGIITEDDVADVLQEEATEDIERLGGSQPLNLPYRLASVPLLVRKRVGWLLLLFLAEAYTGTVLRNFEDELAGRRRAELLHPAADRHGRQPRQPDGDAGRPRDGAQRGRAEGHRLARLQGAAGRARRSALVMAVVAFGRASSSGSATTSPSSSRSRSSRSASGRRSWRPRCRSCCAGSASTRRSSPRR